MTKHPPDLDSATWFEVAKKWLIAGFHVHQKWDCQFCKSRETMDLANRFFTKGVCQQCGKTSEIKVSGFMTMNSPCMLLKDDLPTPPLEPLLYVMCP